MFDPVDMARATEKIVCVEEMRPYYRFGSARFYGGTSTAVKERGLLQGGRPLKYEEGQSSIVRRRSA